jgi:uncharacterized cupredoxin-like copper-binding protein
MRTRTLVAPLGALLVLVAAACGSGGDGNDTAGRGAGGAGGRARTVDVEMRDIGFAPATLTVAQGETVTLRFTNVGKVAHDAFVGDEAAQADHEAEVRDGMGGMHHGDSDDAVTVQPGKTATLTHTFDRTGTVEIGCHQPGHYAAGMKMTVTTD